MFEPFFCRVLESVRESLRSLVGRGLIHGIKLSVPPRDKIKLCKEKIDHSFQIFQVNSPFVMPLEEGYALLAFCFR
jgi:hypothetical protein